MNRGITDPERAAPDATNTTQENQATNQDQVWPHRVIRRGDAMRPSCCECWPAAAATRVRWASPPLRAPSS